MSKKKPAVVPPPSNSDFRQIEIEASLITSLRREAIARGTNAPALVRDLLGMIVSDRLVGAILDAD